jgi:hypothetical protein
MESLPQVQLRPIRLEISVKGCAVRLPETMIRPDNLLAVGRPGGMERLAPRGDRRVKRCPGRCQSWVRPTWGMRRSAD